jgi:gas vesicle protein
MNSGSKVLLGALAGAAAGALLAGLFATEEGEEARSRFAEATGDITNNLKDKFSDLKDNVAEKYESVKQTATDLIEEGMSKASNAASNLK